MVFVFITGPNGSETEHLAQTVLQKSATVGFIQPRKELEIRSEYPDEWGTYLLRQYIRNNSDAPIAPLLSAIVYTWMEGRQRGIIEGYPRNVEEWQELRTLGCDYYLFYVDKGYAGKQLNELKNAIIDSVSPTCRVVGPKEAGLVEHIIGVLSKMQCEIASRARQVRDSFFISITPTSPIVDALTTARVVQCAMNLALLDSRSKVFCGSHPVSLTRVNMELIEKEKYMLSLKLDGIRILGLIKHGTMWLINRKLEVIKGLECKNLGTYEDTLMDLELVGDRFIVIDVISFCRKSMKALPLLCRLASATSICLDYYREYRWKMFQLQEYFELGELPNKASQITEGMSCNNFPVDGIVFTPFSLPYKGGMDKNMFKWKPPHKNTVDFVYKNGYLCTQSVVGGELIPTMVYNLGKGESVKEGEVVECTYSITNETWSIVKVRVDKNAANVHWVAEKVFASIRENITLEDLLQLKSQHVEDE